ncbi:MAG: hypothetical protein Q8L04_07640, partial [Ignavibacteria bacterium]|nr:hypothetical protein [Ignavibacteria bacterium]
LVLILSTLSYSWDYSEHKELGDAAFLRILKRLIESRYFNDQPEMMNFLEKCFQMKYEPQLKNYYFINLSHENNIITYGTLNGLSGDHIDNPLEMNELLQYRSSTLNKIVKLQNEYLSNYETGAANMDVLSKDFQYLLLALTDLSHFHNYGTPLSLQMGEFKKALMRKLERPSAADTVMNELKKTNSINKYVSLHTFAIYLAERAGACYSSDPEKSKELLYYAIIFNSFADHFLEDISASGHMVVNRSLLSGMINNRALHDFYNKEGVNVANLRGETWKQYGDGTLNSRFSLWKSKADYSDIEYTPFADDTDKIINSVAESIGDIFRAFKSASSEPNHKMIFDRIPDDEKKIPDFFLAEYKTLTYTPIPFNTDVSGFNLPQENITEIKQNTQLLPHWSFIKTRVANSISLGLGIISDDIEQWHEYDLRLSLGSSFYSYNYNFDRTKAWTVDYWFGPTISFSLLKGYAALNGVEVDLWAHILKGGIAYNYDIWISESRFLGIYGYIEAGWLRFHSFPNLQINEMGQYIRTEVPGENQFIFSPSIGLQLGALIGINYYEWPIWLRVPIQWLLPLKFRYSAKIRTVSSPEYQWIVELDLVF